MKRERVNEMSTTERDEVLDRTKVLSKLLLKSLAFCLVKVKKTCGEDTARSILTVICDESFNTSDVRDFAPTIEECTRIVQSEVAYENALKSSIDVTNTEQGK